jgi:hypothetical protein
MRGADQSWPAGIFPKQLELSLDQLFVFRSTPRSLLVNDRLRGAVGGGHGFWMMVWDSKRT